jgi:hypothetical protein
MTDVEPGWALSGPETMAGLRDGIQTLIDGLQAVQDTLRPEKMPSDTARAMRALAPGLERLASALMQYQHQANQRLL